MNHKRHMNIHPRTGDYYVRIMRQGVSKYFNLGKNERKARQQLEQIETDIASGRIQFATQDSSTVIKADGSRDMRVEDLAFRHLEWVKSNRAPGTYKNRMDNLKLFLRFVAPCMVSDVTRIRLEEYYSWVKENHGNSANGGNAPLSHVKAMFRWAEEMDLCDLAYKRFPKMMYTPPETPRLTDEETSRLLSAATPDFRDLLELGLLTGLRPPELRELLKTHYINDNGEKYILIQQHKTSRSAKEPKPRTVPLSPQAVAIIERQISKHSEADNIFINDDGTPFCRYTLRNRFRRLCTKAGVRYVPPYALRHTFASMASESHAETTGLAMLMGHSTTRTLMRYVRNTFSHHLKTVSDVGNRIEMLGKGGGQNAKSVQILSPATKLGNGEEAD